VRGSGDSIVCFGDPICLDHTSSGARLACDIWEETMPGKGVYMVSAVPGGAREAAVARSTFIIVPAHDSAGYSEDDLVPVTFGTPFRLQALLAASDEAVKSGLLEPRPTCFLSSTHKSERMASRLTNRQMVFAQGGSNPDCLWTFECAVFSQGTKSAEDKYFSKGQPVESGIPLVLQHKATRQPLLADPAQVEHTDFGAEREVVCHVVVPPNVITSMAREAKGTAVVTVPLEVRPRERTREPTLTYFAFALAPHANSHTCHLFASCRFAVTSKPLVCNKSVSFAQHLWRVVGAVTADRGPSRIGSLFIGPFSLRVHLPAKQHRRHFLRAASCPCDAWRVATSHLGTDSVIFRVFLRDKNILFYWFWCSCWLCYYVVTRWPLRSE